MIPFRLWACDAPERGQSYFTEARAYLVGLVLNKNCTFIPRHIDPYQRHVIELFTPDGGDVALLMLEAGMAWFTKQHAPMNQEYMRAMQRAMANRRGLFIENDPIPPWTFRHHNPGRYQRPMSPIKRRQKA